jgi:hypothetical protein
MAVHDPRRKRLEQAKLLSNSECYQERLEVAQQIIRGNSSLIESERSLAISSYISFARSRCESLQVLQGLIEQQRSRGRIDRSQKLEEIRSSIVSEFLEFGRRFTALLDTSTIPSSKHDIPANVFYLRTKADILRYESEVASEPAKSQLAARARSCYHQALSLLREEAPHLIVAMLGVALNYSVFVFDELKKGRDALDIAQTALTEAAGVDDSANEAEVNEATRLQEVIRQNILDWTRNTQP